MDSISPILVYPNSLRAKHFDLRPCVVPGGKYVALGLEARLDTFVGLMAHRGGIPPLINDAPHSYPMRHFREWVPNAMYTNEELHPSPPLTNSYLHARGVGGNFGIRLKSRWKNIFVNFEHKKASGAAGSHKRSHWCRGCLL